MAGGTVAILHTEVVEKKKTFFFLLPPRFFSRGAVYLAKDRVTREKPVCEHVRGAYTWELSEVSNSKRWLQLDLM